MGMFDYVKSEHLDIPDWGFQTKSLGNHLETYTITSGGRLLREVVEYEPTPQEELSFPDRPWIGCMRAVSSEKVDCNLTRTFSIYDWREGRMHYYHLSFFGGNLENIVYEVD